MDQKKVEFIESYIKVGNGDYKWDDNHGELIRCKDCKFRWDALNCQMYSEGMKTGDDWFCADGERE